MIKLDIESRFIRFFSLIADLMIVNILFVICSVPIFTIGAALTAMHKAIQNIIFDEGNGVIKTFFSSFKENYKFATSIWFAELLIFAGIIGACLLVVIELQSILQTIFFLIICFLGLIFLSGYTWLYPLIARYDNTIKDHIRNATILMLTQLPTTLVIDLLAVIPVVMTACSLEFLLNTSIIWVIGGFSVISYGINILLKPIFKKHESADMQKP